MILTLEVVDREGRFRLVDDDGAEQARGTAQPSVSHPGYVTLLFNSTHAPAVSGVPLRVPISWFETLEAVQ